MDAFTSGNISHDPTPYVWPNVESRLTSGPLRSMFSHGDGIALTFAPRPEFDNHNPILVEFRRSAPWDVVRSARIAAEWLEPPAKPIPASASSEQIDHARRVLTKLAAL